MTSVLVGDCVEVMGTLPPDSFDLIFSDPPFNIGYGYDVYDDNKSVDDYLGWSEGWLRAALRVLKPAGTLWLAIGDAFASDLDVLCRRTLGLHRRSWVVWHYTFGVNATRKFTPSHTHLLHYVMNQDHFTFNADAVKVPSARQLVYGDKRAKAGGRIPDDTWVLRPQACEEAFRADSHCWSVPRVCGTHKGRVGWHPCQMPLAVLDRIIRVSTNPGESVLDPFCGSGTTLVAAERLGRDGVGVELSEEYANKARERVEKEAASA